MHKAVEVELAYYLNAHSLFVELLGAHLLVCLFRLARSAVDVPRHHQHIYLPRHIAHRRAAPVLDLPLYLVACTKFQAARKTECAALYSVVVV